MLIDWFTVAAQIVNFLILLALLKWLLFDRIVRAMDAREERIASRLNDVKQKEEAADRRAEQIAAEHEQLQQARRQKLQEAEEESDRRRKELIGQARNEVDQLRDDWRQGLEQQKEQFIAELSERTRDIFQRIVGETLADLAGTDLQRQTVQTFLHKINTIDNHERQSLRTAIEDDERHLTVAEAMTSEKDHGPIAEALKHHFHGDLDVRFETSPELLAGVELRAHGLAIGWSLRHYLDRFEDSLASALEEQLRLTHTAED